MASAKPPFAERENLSGIYPVHNVRYLSGSDRAPPPHPDPLRPQGQRGNIPAACLALRSVHALASSRGTGGMTKFGSRSIFLHLDNGSANRGSATGSPRSSDQTAASHYR